MVSQTKLYGKPNLIPSKEQLNFPSLSIPWGVPLAHDGTSSEWQDVFEGIQRNG